MQSDKHKQAILVIDDHPIIHDGLDTLLSNEPDLCIVAHAFTAEQAMQLLEKNTPDLAIVDLSMGNADGISMLQRIKKKHPRVRLLVYTMSEEKLFAERAASTGADGYVMKTTPAPELKQALRRVLAGEKHFEPAILTRIQHKRNGRPARPMSILDALTNREMDIFSLVGQGLDSATIGERLGISRNTVDTHRINMKNKLELPSGKVLDRIAYDAVVLGKLPE